MAKPVDPRWDTSRVRVDERFSYFVEGICRAFTHDDNSIRPHSALNGDTPTDARRAPERVEGSAPGARANPSTMRYAEPELSL